jgi:ribokinase
MGELWVVGSLNVDVIVETPRFPLPGETVAGTSTAESFGGKGGNQAVALARLGAKPHMIGAVGDDRAGNEYLKVMELEGIRTGGVAQLASCPTGMALIEVSGRENRIVVVPGANGLLTPSMALQALSGLARGDAILLQLEIPIDTVRATLEFARSVGATSILDPAPARVLPDEILSLVDFITPNETEAAILAEADTALVGKADPLANALALRAKGCKAVVQKAGRKGAYLVAGESALFEPSFPVTVVDTIGAGDSFNAGFAFALARGAAPAEALRWGNAVGSLSTRGSGAQGAMPSLAEVESLLKKQ